MSDIDGIIKGTTLQWAAGLPTDIFDKYRVYWSGTDKLLYDEYANSQYFICEQFGTLKRNYT